MYNDFELSENNEKGISIYGHQLTPFEEVTLLFSMEFAQVNFNRVNFEDLEAHTEKVDFLMREAHSKLLQKLHQEIYKEEQKRMRMREKERIRVNRKAQQAKSPAKDRDIKI